MREREPFQPDDLENLDTRLLSRAWAVIALREVAAGNTSRAVIGMRHDIDDNGWPTALHLARWEAERGYRSTYYVLHTAPYWETEDLRAGLEEIALLGHEVGIHVNAIAEALRTNGEPHTILWDAIHRLREWGHPIRGACSHGDRMCGLAGFVNYEQFSECPKPDLGSPTRELQHGAVKVRLAPVPLDTFGLDYEAYHLPRFMYLSDTGGEWNEPFTQFCERFPNELGQTQVLQHPDWWSEAFTPVAVAA